MKESIGAKTVVYPTPVLIIGTYDKEGKPNVMPSAWSGICCSAPPCVGVSLRKATYTYGNIVERKAFTINIPSEDYVKEVDYFGTVSGRDVDKLSKVGFTPVRSEIVDAPYIKEFPFVLECRLLQAVEIGLHTEFIGEILDVKVESDMLNEDDLPDIKKVRPILFAPESRNYYGIGKLLGKAFSIGRDL